MEIQPCKPYHATLAARKRITMRDGKSSFKIYFLSIIDRENRSRYEWELADTGIGEMEAQLLDAGIEGVGFITAFPHITKVFRFAPEAETVLHVAGFDTPSLTTLDLGRGSAWVEFACYAEALIAADEYSFWSTAVDIPEYLERFSTFEDGPIVSNDKFGRYWSSPD